MQSFEQTQTDARSVILNESSAIQSLSEIIDHNFYQTLKSIYECKGRVVVTGIGKSAIIAQKIVATFNSTGTKALFMHAADAVHGDLGMVNSDDLIIALSQSGNTAEIRALIPIIRQMGNILVAICGNPDSKLAQSADHLVSSKIEQEACPNNLAPTTSTSVQMVIGDVIAVCLINWRKFKSKDFARVHPGGSLGKRLYLTAGDIYPANEKPAVDENASLSEVILEISSKRLGNTAVLSNGKLVGVITDGDLRRMLDRNSNLESVKAKDIMSKGPLTVDKDTMAIEILDLMREKKISQVLVTENEKYAGVVHIHDLNREGLM